MRRLTLAALSAALAITACSDRESPTEPSVPAPQENFGSSCTVVRFPLLSIAAQIIDVFPKGKLQTEALTRAAVIKLFWDTCHPDAARRRAVSFIQWMNENFDRKKLRGATEQDVQDLTIAILAGVGVPVDAPTSEGDVGVGIYDGEKTIIKTASEVALTEIEADAFADGQPRLIVVRRLADNFRLNFGGNQFEPFFDYDATKLTGTTNNADKILATGKFAIIAFCLFPPPFVYPDNVGIGHNPVEGAPGFPFEILPAVNLPAERPDLVQALSCGQLQENPGPIDLQGGLSGLVNGARQAAGRFLVPLANRVLLPEPLWAAASVGFLGPIGGKTSSLSPFGTVEVTRTSTTIESDTPDPSNAGDPISVSFTVSPEGESAFAPTGNVTVSDGNGASCTATIDVGDCSLTPAGVGTITLTAVYEGDDNFAGSSDTEGHTVLVGLGSNTFGVNTGDDGLSTINLTTGATSFIGRLGGGNNNLYTTPIAMAAGPLDQKLYVWNNSGDGITEAANTGVLLTVDPGTGLATPVNAGTPAQGQLGALAFTPGGTLYGTDSDLFGINPATGVKTLIGSLGSGLQVAAADFDCNGTLYGVEFAFGSQRLLTINLTTGAATVVATLSQDVGLVQSILFTQSGTLVATGFGGPSGDILFDINPTTAAVSNLRTVAAGLPQGLGAARTCIIIN